MVWRKILKIEWVGLHDNFFDLGGDSLSAAELAAVFPSEFDMELPLGSIFEAPTIAELASMIERISGEHTDPLGIVLPIRKVLAQAHRPLFCIHPIAGISLAFIGLLRHLDPRVPVYGLQSRGLCDPVDLPGSIEEMAADYLDQILRIQPEGPYRLIGRSLGGLIGHSIATQMQAKGLQVELLAMIDSYLFTAGERALPVSEADEVRAVMKFLDMKTDFEQTPATMEELAKVLVHDYSGRTIPVAQEIMKTNPQFIHHVFAVMLNNMKLARQFVPGTLDLDLVYFQATEGDLQEFFGHSPSAWEPFIEGNIEVHELACDHEAVLDPIPAAHIGSVLRTRLSALDAPREPEWSAA
jgi:enterobactin synthetase component F